jgi:hypothetical protein
LHRCRVVVDDDEPEAERRVDLLAHEAVHRETRVADRLDLLAGRRCVCRSRGCAGDSRVPSRPGRGPRCRRRPGLRRRPRSSRRPRRRSAGGPDACASLRVEGGRPAPAGRACPSGPRRRAGRPRPRR